LSHYVTNAGAFFAFIGRGLGVVIGVGSAFVSLIAYLAIQLAIFGFFGVVMAGEMNTWFGLKSADCYAADVATVRGRPDW